MAEDLRRKDKTSAAATSPVHHAVLVQVIHRQQDLTGVASHLTFLQPPPVADPVHQVAAGAQLHGHVVAVLRLQSLTQETHTVLMWLLFQR